MKRNLLPAVAGFLSVTLCSAPSAPAPHIEWQHSFGGNGNDSLTTLRQTSDGGFILGGWSESEPSGNKTSPYYVGVGSDLWVVRLDARGQMLWDKTFGGDAQDGTPCAIRQTSDGGFILASLSRSEISGNKTSPLLGNRCFFDLWVIRLNPDGDKLWEAVFGGEYNEVFGAIEETFDGGFILGGTSDSGAGGNKTSPGYGEEDYWLVRLDANGTKLWDRSFGGTYRDVLNALQQTSDGGFILGGESRSPANGNKTTPNFSTRDYGLLGDFWVVRVDRDGNKLWDKSYGGEDADGIFGLAQTADGGFLAGGYSYSGATGNKSSSNLGIIDYWVVRADAAGEILWDRTYGGGGVSVLFSLRTTIDGGFVLGGYSNDSYAEGRVGNKTSPSFGEFDYWVVRTDGLGNILWDLSLGGTNDDYLFDLQQTADGGFVVGGESVSSTNGNKTSPGYGLRDYWTVKIAAEDSDADGVPDLRDLCSHTATGAIVNAGGCSIEQLAPCDGPWRNHGQYVRAVVEVSSEFLKTGLISREQRRAIVIQAAKSDCGTKGSAKK